MCWYLQQLLRPKLYILCLQLPLTCVPYSVFTAGNNWPGSAIFILSSGIYSTCPTSKTITCPVCSLLGPTTHICNIADFCVMQCRKGFVEVMVDLQKDDQSVTQALSPDGPPPISTSNLIFLPRFPSVTIHLLMEGHLLHPPTISWIQPKPTSFFVMVFVLGLTRSYQSSLCSLQGQDGEKLFSVLPRIQRHQQPHFVFNFPTQSR